MHTKKADVLSSAILHLQCSLEYLDEVKKCQDLFKQDFKQQVNRTIELTEGKLNQIWAELDNEGKELYMELMNRKTAIYTHIDHLNTFEAISLFENYVKFQSKLIA